MVEKLQALDEQFEAKFGYPPGENVLVMAHPGDAGDELDRLVHEGVDQVLVEFYRRFASLSLPDVANGYFIRALDEVLDPDSTGSPTEASELPGVKILVFGSDGGGSLFALPAGSAGPVYRLPPGEISRSCYMDSVEAVSEDFMGFLDMLYRRLEEFTG